MQGLSIFGLQWVFIPSFKWWINCGCYRVIRHQQPASATWLFPRKNRWSLWRSSPQPDTSQQPGGIPLAIHEVYLPLFLTSYQHSSSLILYLVASLAVTVKLWAHLDRKRCIKRHKIPYRHTDGPCRRSTWATGENVKDLGILSGDWPTELFPSVCRPLGARGNWNFTGARERPELLLAVSDRTSHLCLSGHMIYFRGKRI